MTSPLEDSLSLTFLEDIANLQIGFYPPQVKACRQIMDAFVSGKRWVMLAAKPQTGKTGAGKLVAFSTKLPKFESLGINKIIIISSDNRINLKEQWEASVDNSKKILSHIAMEMFCGTPTDERTCKLIKWILSIGCIKIDVLFRGPDLVKHLKKENCKSTLFIWDECDYGIGSESKFSDMLDEMEWGDCVRTGDFTTFATQNNYMLTITATRGAECANDAFTRACGQVYMPPGGDYKDIQWFLDNNKIFPILKDFSEISEIFDKYTGEKKIIVVRAGPETKPRYKNTKSECDRRGWSYGSLNQQSNNITDMVKIWKDDASNTRPYVIFLKNFWSRGDDITLIGTGDQGGWLVGEFKSMICAWIESWTTNSHTYIQRASRVCGYDFNSNIDLYCPETRMPLPESVIIKLINEDPVAKKKYLNTSVNKRDKFLKTFRKLPKTKTFHDSSKYCWKFLVQYDVIMNSGGGLKQMTGGQYVKHRQTSSNVKYRGTTHRLIHSDEIISRANTDGDLYINIRGLITEIEDSSMSLPRKKEKIIEVISSSSLLQEEWQTYDNTELFENPSGIAIIDPSKKSYKKALDSMFKSIEDKTPYLGRVDKHIHISLIIQDLKTPSGYTINKGVIFQYSEKKINPGEFDTAILPENKKKKSLYTKGKTPIEDQDLENTSRLSIPHRASWESNILEQVLEEQNKLTSSMKICSLANKIDLSISKTGDYGNTYREIKNFLMRSDKFKKYSLNVKKVPKLRLKGVAPNRTKSGFVNISVTW